MSTCTILHTSDFHNRLTPAKAQHLAQLKAEAPDTLLLDSGDAVSAGNLGFRPRGEPALRLMNDAGYDAMAMGNRESHPTRAVLERKLADVRFPVLAANLMAKRQPLPRMVRSHILRRLPNGLRVAVVGLAPQITRPDSWWGRVTDYVFDDPEKTATGLVHKLRGEVDLVVLLTHLGPGWDRKLAAVPGVDLVLGGHGHVEIVPPEAVAGAYVAHPGAHAQGVARITVEVAEGKIAQIAGELIPL
jgi:2',3'-cyclic-nucleotide 2'-phosphodiesterase (5'-nucleotidase family)